MVFSEDFDSYLQEFSENLSFFTEADENQQQQNNNQQNTGLTVTDNSNQNNQQQNNTNNQQQNNAGNKLMNGVKGIVQKFLAWIKKIKDYFMTKLKNALDNDQNLIAKAKAAINKVFDKSMKVDWCFASDASRDKAMASYPDFETFQNSGNDAQQYEQGSAEKLYFEKPDEQASINSIGGVSAIIARHDNVKKSLNKVAKWQIKNENAATRAQNNANENDANRFSNFFNQFHNFSTEFYQCYVKEYRIVKAALTKVTASENPNANTNDTTKNESYINKCVLTALYEADMALAM